MSNCVGCGSVVDPTQDEANQAVNDVLVASLKDAKKHGEICPLCGHSQAQPVSQRKTVLFVMLALLLIIAIAIAITNFRYRSTERRTVAEEALKQLGSNSVIAQYLGQPISIQGEILGSVRHDETGWAEARLTIPVHGPKGDATVQVTGGRETGPWKFTTLEVLMPQAQKKADLITGKVVEYDPKAYVETHTEAAVIPESVLTDVPAPHWNGDFPCVFATATAKSAPQFGSCTTPMPMSKASRTPRDRFEADLRRGKFNLRQTDLSISEAGFDIPLTRTYTSDDWITRNRPHAFGMNSNHPYDIAPVGTRNPYTEMFIVLEDADFLYLPRVSRGSSYADAVYRQSEVGNSFYKALQRWDGRGWEVKLQDGSSIHFPESYSAKNMAQGAPTEMTDAAGNKIELIRNPQRNLLEIKGPNGESIKLAYDDYDRIVRAENSQGAWTNYTYNSAGLVMDVVHSDRTERHYFYEDGLMTSVRDEQNRLLIQNTYGNLTHFLSQQQFGNGDTIVYRYDLSPNGKFAERTRVVLPDGTIKVIETGDTVSDKYKNMP